MELAEREKKALTGAADVLRGLALKARREGCGYAWLARQCYNAQEEVFPAEMLEAFGRLIEGELIVGVRYLARVLDLDEGQYMPTMAQANALHKDIMRYRDAHPDADPEEIIEYNRARFDELRERIRAEGLMSGIPESVRYNGSGGVYGDETGQNLGVGKRDQGHERTRELPGDIRNSHGRRHTQDGAGGTAGGCKDRTGKILRQSADRDHARFRERGFSVTR